MRGWLIRSVIDLIICRVVRFVNKFSWLCLRYSSILTFGHVGPPTGSLLFADLTTMRLIWVYVAPTVGASFVFVARDESPQGLHGPLSHMAVRGLWGDCGLGQVLLGGQVHSPNWVTRARACFHAVFVLHWLLCFYILFLTGGQPLHYGEVVMGGVTFRFANFESHFIHIQIFPIDF